MDEILTIDEATAILGRSQRGRGVAADLLRMIDARGASLDGDGQVAVLALLHHYWGRGSRCDVRDALLSLSMPSAEERAAWGVA